MDTTSTVPAWLFFAALAAMVGMVLLWLWCRHRVLAGRVLHMDDEASSARLRAEGIPAVATILETEPTDVIINGSPVVFLRLQVVEVASGDIFAAVLHVRLTPELSSQIKPGQRVAVKLDRRNAKHLVLDL